MNRQKRSSDQHLIQRIKTNMASNTKSSRRSKPNRSARLAIATSMKFEGSARREPCEPLAMSAKSAAFAQVSRV